MGLRIEGRNPIFAFSSAVDVINGVVGGAAVAIALGAVVDASLGLAAGVGIVAAVVSFSPGFDTRTASSTPAPPGLNRCFRHLNPAEGASTAADPALTRAKPVSRGE